MLGDLAAYPMTVAREVAGARNLGEHESRVEGWAER